MAAEAKELLEKALSQMHFSGRAYDKIRKVARTIADIAPSTSSEQASSDLIQQPHHISEAVQERSLDREVW